MDQIVIRRVKSSDRPDLLKAIVELQNFERELHDTRLPGEQIADSYTDWMLSNAESSGSVFLAEVDGMFAGFVSGWIEQEESLAETADSNRFGYISDLCVLSTFRGKRIANHLLDAMVAHFRSADVARVRVGFLAANRSAKIAYERAGFRPYETIYEIRL